MGNEEAFRLKNGGDYAISPYEAFTVIEKFSHTFSVFAFLLVVGIINGIINDEQYPVTFFEAKLFKPDLPSI
jgi:hypothetical protein